MSLDLSEPTGWDTDPAKLEQLMSGRKAQESLPLALIAGFIASMVAAFIWAGVTYATGYQIGFMAIGVGFLVGYAVNYAGKGMSVTYSVIGAVFALLGCFVGNILTIIIAASMEEGSSVVFVLITILSAPVILLEAMKETFSPMDLLFYAIAIYEGYKLSVRPLTDEELDSIRRIPPPPPAEAQAAPVPNSL